MNDVFYLAWRYMAHNRWKTLTLVASITLIMYLPAGMRVIVRQSERDLTARAAVTPLVVGAKGSPLELVLSSLYFESQTVTATDMSQVERIRDTRLAGAMPLHVTFNARGVPIVGTTLDYFTMRGLGVSDGHNLATLGDCVVGSAAARTLGVAPGDAIISSPENVVDIAGVYPLKMNVVGVLAPSQSADDNAAFVDIKTAWIIAGVGHGHQDLAAPEARSGVLRREGDRIVANAAVVHFNEITEDNIDSFHFHGDAEQFPVTAIIALPNDDKASALLQGKYLSDEDPVQIVRPAGVVDELLATVFTVESYVVTAMIILGASTLATAVLVFLLSLQLRRRELRTMSMIGGSRGIISGMIVTEIVGVVGISIALAAILTGVTSTFASEVIRALLLS